MATRQNKKRKGRQNVINRERTVTQLTEDPNTTFSVPSSSEDQQHNPRFNNTNNSAQFSGFNNYMHNPNYAPAPDAYLPPGQNDLEVLEKLKETIKNGQHEFFRAVPQPSALARVYLGSSSPHNASSQVPPHPEQVPPHNRPTNGGEYAQRPRNQSFSMDWDTAGTRTSPSTPPSQPQANRYENATNGNNVKPYPPSGPAGAARRDSLDVKPPRDVPPDLGPRSSFSRPPVQPVAAPRLDQPSRPNGEYAPKESPSLKDSKEDLRQHDSWPQRPGQSPQDERLSRPPPQPLDPADRTLDAGRPSDRGKLDRERDRETDRSRDRDDRRFDRYERPRIIDNRRPPPDQRHWEPPRRVEHGNPIDRRGPEADTVRAGDRHVATDDRQSRPVVDDRLPSARVVDARNDTTDDHRGPLPPTNDARRASNPTGEERANNRPTATPHTIPSASASVDSAARSADASDDRVNSRPQQAPPGGPKEERQPVPLEDRISRSTAPPSLQDRLNQPPVINDARTSARPPPTGPSLEERLSHPPNIQHENVRSDGRIPATYERRPGPRILGAPIDRTGGEDRGRPTERPPTEDRKPPHPATSAQAPPRPSVYSRAPSVTRDEVSIRDYRTGAPPPGPVRSVSVSREHPPELRASSYRPDYIAGDRRTDVIDVDRFSESRPLPPASYRRSPPPIQSERGIWERPTRWPPASPPRTDAYEDPRFRAGAAYHPGQSQWPEYDSRGRAWDDKDHHSRQWEQNENWGPADRRFVEREAVPPATWETRQEREQREQRERAYPPIALSAPPAERPPYDSRPLSSRLTDSYAATAPASQPPQGDERGYAGDLDNHAPYPPSSAAPIGEPSAATFSRVRQRSASPSARDASRPPMKRPREEYSSSTTSAPIAANDYYSPHAPGAVAPPPHNFADYAGAYERPGAYAASAPTRDREHLPAGVPPRDSYQGPPPPAGYDRRMPPPSRPTTQSSYPPQPPRGPYVRDDRRYGPP